MQRTTLSTLAVMAIAAPALAQSTMYALDASCNLRLVNRATGLATLIGPTGFTGCNAAAADPQGRIFTHSSNSDQLVLVDPTTGLGTVHLNLLNRPTGHGIRGMAFNAQGELYMVLSQASTTTVDPLVRIDMTTGQYIMVGNTGRTDIQGLAFSGAGVLYASGAGGNLYTLDVGTGAATVVALSTLGGDGQALDFDVDGTLYATRNTLRTVNPLTGATIQIIGETGADIRGTAIVGTGASCYANCDGSTVEPILNIDDFTCFINEFAAGSSLPHQQQVSHYANCDGSTVNPALNIDDFTCFINAFAAGCP